MEGYAKRDRVTTYIETKKEELRELEKQENELEDEINKLNYLMSNNDTEANKLKTIIDNTIIFPREEMEQVVVEFFKGWLEWLTSDKRPEGFKDHSHRLVKEFISINIHQMPEANEN